MEAIATESTATEPTATEPITTEITACSQGGGKHGHWTHEEREIKRKETENGGGRRKLYVKLCQYLNLVSMCRQPVTCSQAGELPGSALLPVKSHTRHRSGSDDSREGRADPTLLGSGGSAFLCAPFSREWSFSWERVVG